MDTEFIIKSSAAFMPSSCKGIYRRIGILEVEQGAQPKMISSRARGVVKVVRTWEKLNVGLTERSAYGRAMKEAQAMVKKLNAERAAQKGSSSATH